MKTIALGVVPLLALAARAQTCNSTGPDVITGAIDSLANYTGEPGYDAIALAMTICNVGDASVAVSPNSNQHPVFAPNLYKLTLGPGPSRIEHVGMGWLFHEFAVLQNTACCAACEPSGTTSALGPRCSSSNTASISGFQSQLGPRWQVNAATGQFTMPRANPPFSGATARRLRVPTARLEPSTAGVRYFGEGVYIAPDDAAAGNNANNASCRELTAFPSGSEWNFIPTGPTYRATAAVEVWAQFDPAVHVAAIDIPGDGRLLVASRATSIPGGRWHYEYAIQNLSSHRSVGGLFVPADLILDVSNIVFRDAEYHSGDGIPANPADPDNTARNFDGADWPADRLPAGVSWATTPYAENDNANALRWGTLYGFAFDTDWPPAFGDLSVSLFRPGTPSIVSAPNLHVPRTPCLADFNRSGGTPDDADIAAFFVGWNDGDPLADINRSGGSPDDADVAAFFDRWNEGC